MTKLARSLRTPDMALLVVGMALGAGIFVVPATTVRLTDAAGPALLVWALGGALSLLGALTFAELGAMIPEVGGLYAFIRDSFGRLPAFLYGWVLFFVMGGGVLAALSVAATGYVGQLVSLGPWATTLLPIGLIVAVVVVNVMGTRRAAGVTNLTSILKVVAVLVMSTALMLAPGASVPAPMWSPDWSGTILSGVGVAMLGVLWAYEGWQWVTFSAGETTDPQRVFPRGLVGGIAVTIFVYLLANAGYLAALGPEAMARSEAVAADAAGAVFGAVASKVIAVVAIVAIISALNGLALTVPRVFYAMAADGLFFRRLAAVHPRYGTPAWAIASIGLVGVVLSATGTFDALLTYVMFTAWIFYALAGASLFVFRRRAPERPRPFRVPGYPITPAVFVLAAIAVVGNTLLTQPIEASFGLGVTASGVPFYYLWQARLGSGGGY